MSRDSEIIEIDSVSTLQVIEGFILWDSASKEQVEQFFAQMMGWT